MNIVSLPLSEAYGLEGNDAQSCSAQATLYMDFLDQQQALSLFALLKSTLAWQEESISVYGKSIKVPRLMCWYGDEHAHYRYSGIDHKPLPWDKTLIDIKQRIETLSHAHFNSVLGNLYRDGNDSMGWHADNEKELGKNPTIASISLGQTRTFKLRHNKSKKVISTELPSGSLLVMRGSIQHQWQHSLPKSKHPMEGRINLTYRNISE